jgi:protein-tyrosine-phosphatase
MDKRIAGALGTITEEELIVWDVDDPWGDDAIEYRRTAILMHDRIGYLLDDLGVTPGHTE